MLKHELLKDESILIVVPEAPLKAKDFKDLNREVDPYIAETGKLNGLMIYAVTFSGWETFAAFIGSSSAVNRPVIRFASVFLNLMRC